MSIFQQLGASGAKTLSSWGVSDKVVGSVGRGLRIAGDHLPMVGMFTGFNMLTGESFGRSVVNGVRDQLLWTMFPLVMGTYYTGLIGYEAVKSMPEAINRLAGAHDPHSYRNYHTRTQEAAMCRNLGMAHMDQYQRIAGTATRGLGKEAMMLHRNW